MISLLMDDTYIGFPCEPFTKGEEMMICQTRSKLIALLSVYACFLVVLMACGNSALTGLTTGTTGTTGTTTTTTVVLSGASPAGALAGGTTQTTLSLTTNVNATCKYATSSGVTYASMPNTFTNTGSTAHSTMVTGLTNGTSYNYYVKCQDTSGNTSSDYPISFMVASLTGGNSYYVDIVNGSDTNSGSITSPWKYLDTSVHKLAPGDTLYVRQGTYVLSPTNSSAGALYLKSVSGDDGAAGAFKTVMAYPGEKPVVTMQVKNFANYWAWKGLTFVGTTTNPLWFYVRPYDPWNTLAIPAGNTSMPLSIWPHDIQIIGNTFKGVIGGNDGAIHIYGSNVLIENNDLSQLITANITTPSTGIYISSGDNNTVRGNIISGPNDYIMEVYDEQRSSGEVWTRWITNVTIEGNIFYSPAGGITAADGSNYNALGFNASAGTQTAGKNLIVRNNIVYGTSGTAYAGRSGTSLAALQFGAGSGAWDNTKIYNNTVFQPILTAPCLSIWGHQTNVSVKNNIFNLGTSSVHVATGGLSFTLNNNLYWPGPPSISGGTTTDSSPVVGDPKFVNASTNPTVADLHLQSSTAGSAAVDRGLTLTEVPTDRDGTARPQGPAYDIGAYEFH